MLISVDTNNVGSMISVNWGCTTNNGNPQDCSDLPLFANVDPGVETLPTFAALAKLFDNYDPSPSVVEDHTQEEKLEELAQRLIGLIICMRFGSIYMTEQRPLWDQVDLNMFLWENVAKMVMLVVFTVGGTTTGWRGRDRSTIWDIGNRPALDRIWNREEESPSRLPGMEHRNPTVPCTWEHLRNWSLPSTRSAS